MILRWKCYKTPEKNGRIYERSYCPIVLERKYLWTSLLSFCHVVYTYRYSSWRYDQLLLVGPWWVRWNFFTRFSNSGYNVPLGRGWWLPLAAGNWLRTITSDQTVYTIIRRLSFWIPDRNDREVLNWLFVSPILFCLNVLETEGILQFWDKKYAARHSSAGG